MLIFPRFFHFFGCVTLEYIVQRDFLLTPFIIRFSEGFSRKDVMHSTSLPDHPGPSASLCILYFQYSPVYCYHSSTQYQYLLGFLLMFCCVVQILIAKYFLCYYFKFALQCWCITETIGRCLSTYTFRWWYSNQSITSKESQKASNIVYHGKIGINFQLVNTFVLPF